MPPQTGKREATVKEMIGRFRNAPPTSRRQRDQSRQKGTAPVKMWYDNSEILPRMTCSAAGATLRGRQGGTCRDTCKEEEQQGGEDDEMSVLQLAEAMRTKSERKCKPFVRFKADATKIPVHVSNKRGKNTARTRSSSSSKWGDLDDDTSSACSAGNKDAPDNSGSSDDDFSTDLPFTIPQVANDLDNSLYGFYDTYTYARDRKESSE